MSDEKKSNRIEIPVDLTNPGQFFACCGLLELADRLWPGAEGWFEGDRFFIQCGPHTSQELIESLRDCAVANTMTPAQLARLRELSAMNKKQRAVIEGAEEEKKSLESLRRELPIVVNGKIAFRIDWFTDDLSGGSRFKTWAGQQSVLDIAQAMHGALDATSEVWSSRRKIGLPFNFDSDLGGQGSALDIGFSFDPLAGSEATRVEGVCKPALEILCFIGLQRFRPREIHRENRFIYAAWNTPLLPSVAAAVTCGEVSVGTESMYEFKLLYRTKYLKSFLPAIPFQGDHHE